MAISYCDSSDSRLSSPSLDQEFFQTQYPALGSNRLTRTDAAHVIRDSRKAAPARATIGRVECANASHVRSVRNRRLHERRDRRSSTGLGQHGSCADPPSAEKATWAIGSVAERGSARGWITVLSGTVCASDYCIRAPLSANVSETARPNKFGEQGERIHHDRDRDNVPGRGH